MVRILVAKLRSTDASSVDPSGQPNCSTRKSSENCATSKLSRRVSIRLRESVSNIRNCSREFLFWAVVDLILIETPGLQRKYISPNKWLGGTMRT